LYGDACEEVGYFAWSREVRVVESKLEKLEAAELGVPRLTSRALVVMDFVGLEKLARGDEEINRGGNSSGREEI
jgi:hypothetical protein